MKKFLGNLLAACMCGFLVSVPVTGFTQAVWPEQGVPDYQELRAKVKAEGPKLLFSDSPEMVYETVFYIVTHCKVKVGCFFIMSMVQVN